MRRRRRALAVLLATAALPRAQVVWSNQGGIAGRLNHAQAYDAARRTCVRYGGADLTNLRILDETWTFDGSVWQLQTPTRSPGPLAYAAMAFDEVRGSLLLFGGTHATRGSLNETWVWDGSDWTQLQPAVQPGARQLHSMAYDRRRGRIVLVGANTTLADTWEWDGRDWRQAAGQPLVSTGIPSLAYDAARQRVVLFGAGAAADEHWEWDGSNWSRRQPTVLPSARTDAAITFDEARDRLVMFGGTLNSRGRLYTDTWELRSEVEAGYSVLGGGCGAGTPPLQLASAGGQRPWWGENLTVEVAPLPAATAGVALALAASSSQWNGLPLPVDITAIGAPRMSIAGGARRVVAHADDRRTRHANDRRAGGRAAAGPDVVPPGTRPGAGQQRRRAPHVFGTRRDDRHPLT